MICIQNTTSNTALKTLCLPMLNALLAQIQSHIPHTGIHKDSELVIRFVTKDEITQLNTTYRKKPLATNVLSFANTLPAHINPALGDVVICADVVKAQALAEHKSFEHHLTHIILHGILHLLGYDHIKDKEAKVMEQLEIHILHSLGIGNPYL